MDALVAFCFLGRLSDASSLASVGEVKTGSTQETLHTKKRLE